MTTLARDLRDHPPSTEIEYKPATAWNCAHNLARWTTGCACTPGNSHWKGALRQAMENLSSNLKEIYLDYAREMGIRDPWKLREDYLLVRLGALPEGQFLAQQGLELDRQAKGLCNLLLANFYSQRSFASYAFFYDDLDRLESYYAITNAARVARLLRRATGHDLEPQLRRDLALAVSGKTGKNGAQMLDEVLEWALKNRRCDFHPPPGAWRPGAGRDRPMLLSILSDTHDNIWALQAALPRLAETDVAIHCGDLVSPFMLKELGEGMAGKPVHMVWGNNNGDMLLIQSVAAQLGNITLHGELAEMALGGVRIAVNHYPAIGRALAASGKYRPGLLWAHAQGS